MEAKVVLVVTALLFVGGCLTPEQQQELRALNTRMETLKGRIVSYEDEVAAVITKIQNHQMPYQEGITLIKDILKKKAEDKRALVDAIEQAKKVREAGTPWWAIAGTLLMTVLGVAGGRKALIARKVLQTVILGVEDHQQDVENLHGVVSKLAAMRPDDAAMKDLAEVTAKLSAKTTIQKKAEKLGTEPALSKEVARLTE